MKAIVSQYADDAGLAPIIKEFVSCLSDRTTAMRDHLSSGNFPDLERLAHQLRGAGGSYGYPTLTGLAEALEEAARARDGERGQKVLSELEALCEAIAEGIGIGVESGAEA
jgi:HPt (histidine-containing phosphotransfer) domain-containing protein